MEAFKVKLVASVIELFGKSAVKVTMGASHRL